MASNILRRWAKAGYTPAQVRSWAHAAAMMRPNIGPQMQAVLKRYGLDDLTTWAAEAIIQGKSQEQILLELFDQPAFKQRFPAIASRESQGLPPISIDDYLAYEQTASSLGSTWGLSLSKQETDDLLSNDVSPQELEQRFTIAATAVYESDTETRGELNRLFGVTNSQLMRYWMNPKKELGDLQNQMRTAEVAGAALRSGYGQVEEPSARRLVESGLDREQALSGFGRLAALANAFTPISRTERLISREEQIEMLAGDATLEQEVETRLARRIARFAGGGTYAPGEEGFTTGVAAR